ncbi:unknown [Prevotella sp. CAG:1124]|nr:unknown [Prevotella sp. CAG:1124]
MVIYIGNCTGKVFVSIVRTIDKRKSVIAEFGQFEGMRKTIMHSSDIRECPSCIADGKGSARASTEEEQARVTFLGVSLFLCFRINVKECATSMCFQVIADFDSLIRINIVVPHQTQLFQCLATPVSFIHRENQPSPVSESRIVHYITDATCASERLLFFIREEKRQGIIDKLHDGIVVVLSTLSLMV